MSLKQTMDDGRNDCMPPPTHRGETKNNRR